MSQLARNALLSKSVAAVGANTWTSPVHPIRSSRCGQSVGTERKLPRIDQTTFSWSRFSRSCDESNHPVRRMSLWRTTARTASGSRSPGQPVISAYLNPWKVPIGSSVCAPPSEDEAVRRGGSAQRPRAQLAVLDDLRVTDDDLGAGGSCHGESETADEVLPEVDPVRACRHPVDADRGDLFDPSHGLEGARLGDHVRLDDGCWSAWRGVASQIDRLAGVDAGVDDLPVAGGGPRLVRADDLAVSVGVDQVQFQRRRRLLAVDPRALRPEAVLLGEPAPRESDLDAVRSSAGEEGEDVDRVVQHAGVVARPARDPARCRR